MKPLVRGVAMAGLVDSADAFNHNELFVGTGTILGTGMIDDFVKRLRWIL